MSKAKKEQRERGQLKTNPEAAAPRKREVLWLSLHCAAKQS